MDRGKQTYIHIHYTHGIRVCDPKEETRQKIPFCDSNGEIVDANIGLCLNKTNSNLGC